MAKDRDGVRPEEVAAMFSGEARDEALLKDGIDGVLRALNGDEMDSRMPVFEKPYRMAAEDRIEALSRAITRTATGGEIDVRRVREWAYEILCQCELIRWMGQAEDSGATSGGRP